MQTSFSSLGVGVLDVLEEVAAGSVDMKSIAAAAEEDEELADVAEVSPALVGASVLSGASVVLASSIFRVRSVSDAPARAVSAVARPPGRPRR